MVDPSINVLYESASCLVLNKPAGLATQAPAQFDSLERHLRHWLAERHPEREFTYLGVPHRLDRPASGAIVFATRRRAAYKLSRQFERREIKKLYWACVEGEVEPAECTWTDWMRKVYGHPRAELVTRDEVGAQLAVLHYRVIGRSPFGSCLEIVLQTGRTHQIRLQASSRGHPVLGDVFYGGVVPFGQQFDDERLRAIALHARSLSFVEPASKEMVTIEAPRPQEWQAIGVNLPGERHT